MKRNSLITTIHFLVMLSLLMFAESALSRPIASGATATMNLSGTFGSTIGGEFNITVSEANGDSHSFIGFCLELDEEIRQNTPYSIDPVMDYAAQGGVAGHDVFDINNDPIGDTLSDASKWVYWNYMLGQAGVFAQDRDTTLADNVQRTIWALEFETLTIAEDPDTDYIEADDSFDRAAFMSISGGFYETYITNGGYNYSAITGDVYVLNLMEGNKFIQSVVVGEPVPEPATILLFGTGIIGLLGFARKRNKK